MKCQTLAALVPLICRGYALKVAEITPDQDDLRGLSDIAAPYTETWRGFQEMAHSAHDYALPSRAKLRAASRDVSLIQMALPTKEPEEPHLTAWQRQGAPVQIQIKPALFVELFIQGLGLVVVATLCALVYRYHGGGATDEAIKSDAAHPHEFEYRLFDTRNCSAELMMCSCCCMCIRWASTLNELAIVSFWPAFFTYACLSGFNGLFLGFGSFILLFVLILARQKIRDRYGMENGTIPTYCEDCWIWMCCACCAGAQEARQVQFVKHKWAARSEPSSNMV